MLWGPSGTGKSRFVAACWPDAFWKAPESKWWDGYSGQETVVLDDFKDYAMPLVELQRLLDWYPVGRGQGRSVPMMAKRYVLTRIPARTTGISGGPTSYRPAQDFRFRRALRPAYRMPGRVGSFLPPGPGAGGWGNTRAQPRDPPDKMS